MASPTDGFGGAGAEADVARRGPGWFIKWLRRDEPYTPQPYQQCAQVLREMGHPEMANDVLYAGRERERKQAWRTGNNPLGTGLTLLKWFVGYGYGSRLLWRPLGWALVIVVVGALLPEIVGLLPADLRPEASSWCAEVSQGEPPTCLTNQPFGWRFLFSLDMLLPIVELSREHSVLQAGLDGIAYGWFVVQRLLGWALALFLIAGLTGLTK